MDKRRLQRDFFTRDALVVAPDLLGCNIVRVIEGGELINAKITEVEAYKGVEDLASHASKGRTKRTSIMFANGGVIYMYFIYGIHWMLNIVTGKTDEPQAILIRGLDKVNGPGRLSRYLKVDKNFNGEDLCFSDRIWIEEKYKRPRFKTGPRVGVDYAGEYWANRPWRFIVEEKSKL
jgi:DNA-3-methyladenine glycosylase